MLRSFQEFELFFGIGGSLHHCLLDIFIDGFGDLSGVGGDLLLLLCFISFLGCRF
jgi:hypothetical protein